MLHYSDLTDWQKGRICNGCGGKGSIIKVPNFLFRASCDQHDFYYWRGSKEEDRKKADKAFYRYMRLDIKGAKWYLKSHYHLWALSYYLMVRVFGKKYFTYSDGMKTKDDLRRI